VDNDPADFERATRGQLGHHGALLPLCNKWFTIGSTCGLVGFIKAESCFLAISKGDLRIQKLFNSLLPLYSPNILLQYKPFRIHF
jgi:hypothetical protein